MKKILVFCIIIILFALFILELNKHILNTEQLYFNSLIDQMDLTQIELMKSDYKKWEWLIYLMTVISYPMKFLIVSCCLYIGAFFMNKRLKFSELFLVAIKAETVFIFLSLFKIIWFSVFKTDYTYLDFATFSPMSLLNIVGMESVDKIWHYPLQVFSLFEIIYWFVLAFGVKELLGKDLAPSFKLVLSSYGLGLLSWIVVIMFITATLS